MWNRSANFTGQSLPSDFFWEYLCPPLDTITPTPEGSLSGDYLNLRAQQLNDFVVWVIVRDCSVVLRRTVVGVDWRFDNLIGSHHQSDHGFRSGCRNVSQHQQQSFSRLHYKPGRSLKPQYWLTWVQTFHCYSWMILNPRATRSFVLIWIETSIEKSKYGLLDLRVHKENDNAVKKIETQFCDSVRVCMYTCQVCFKSFLCFIFFFLASQGNG